MKRIIIAIALSFILASCGGSDQSAGLYAGGTNGLVFSFEDGAPPDLVYDNGQTPMPIIMRVKNDGEFDTQNLQIRLSGISMNDFAGLSMNYNPADSYTGKALIQNDLIEGSEAYLTLADVGEVAFTRSLRGGGSLDYTLHADACYGYATLGTAQLCLESNYNDAQENCDPDSSSLEVSAGPVQLSNLETNAIGGNILRISFDVVKADSIEIWSPVSGQNCNPPTRAQIASQRDWVYVRVDDGFTGQNVISCSNLLDGDLQSPRTILRYDQEYRETVDVSVTPDAEGYVRLSSGSSSVSCTMRVPGGNDGISTIDVALAYFAQDRITHDFTVVHTDVIDGGTADSEWEEYCERMPSDPGCR